MLIYLDSVVVIYAVEGAPALQARAKARLSALHSAGDDLATSISADWNALSSRSGKRMRH
jgi:hypothetical protein